MTHFASTLKRFLTETATTQHDLARSTGLQDSHISRILSGQRFISPDAFERIVAAFSRDFRTGGSTPLRSAALVAAHCLDERTGPGSEFVKIHVDASPIAPESGLFGISPKAQRAIEFLRSAVIAKEIDEQLLIQLATLAGLRDEVVQPAH